MTTIPDTKNQDAQAVADASCAPSSSLSPLDAAMKFVRMRVINRYLFKTVLTAFSMSLAIITFIMLMGSLVQIISLIFKNVSVLVIVKLLLWSMPAVICYALPFSMAAATLLVYSRLSADGEITAMKATGISIFRIAAPSLVLSLLVALVAVPAYNNILPKSHFKQANIVANYRHTDTGSLIETGTWIPLGRYRFFVNYKDGNMFRNITIIEDLDGGVTRIINAERGYVRDEHAENRVLFELLDVVTEERSADRTNSYLRMTAGRVNMYVDMAQLFTKGQKRMDVREKPGHLTSAELHAQVTNAEARIPLICAQAGKTAAQLRKDISAASAFWSKLQRTDPWRALLKERKVSASHAWIDIVGHKLYAEYAAALAKLDRDGSAVRLLEQWKEAWPQPMHNILETRSRNNTEIMKRLSYAFASIAFAMIGIPLGIRAHRSEKSIGFLICLVLIAIHYTLVICVTTFSESYGARPDLLVWLPDILFLATGAALMWRIHKYA